MFCVYFILHAFGISVVAFDVINIDIISYLVVKNVIPRFRPCWVYPVGWLIRCYGNASVESVSVGQMLYQPVGGDLCTNLLVVIC